MAIQQEPRERVIGRRIVRYDQVGSTNDICRSEARSGEGEGLVVLAEEQTSGRGRRGRAWQAPPGSSLLMSVLLRPVWLAPDAAFGITMMAGVALCEAVEMCAPDIAAGLKWPNDLLLPSSPPSNRSMRKAAGILSELVLAGERIDYVVLGVGVNVNWSPEGVVDGRDLGASATSVSKAAGHTIGVERILEALIERLDIRYKALRRGQREALFAAWRARLSTLGSDVTVTTPGGVIHGYAEDVDPAGALLVRDKSGTLHTITAGDVQA